MILVYPSDLDLDSAELEGLHIRRAPIFKILIS